MLRTRTETYQNVRHQDNIRQLRRRSRRSHIREKSLPKKKATDHRQVAVEVRKVIAEHGVKTNRLVRICFEVVSFGPPLRLRVVEPEPVSMSCRSTEPVE